MRKSLFIILIASFALCLLSVNMFAESEDFNRNHEFKLRKDAQIAGKSIEAGSYMARLNEDGTLVIFDGEDLLLEALVEVEPLGGVNPNSMTFDRNGVLEEVRFSEQKVVFPTISNAGRTAE